MQRLFHKKKPKVTKSVKLTIFSLLFTVILANILKVQERFLKEALKSKCFLFFGNTDNPTAIIRNACPWTKSLLLHSDTHWLLTCCYTLAGKAYSNGQESTACERTVKHHALLNWRAHPKRSCLYLLLSKKLLHLLCAGVCQSWLDATKPDLVPRQFSLLLLLLSALHRSA